MKRLLVITAFIFGFLCGCNVRTLVIIENYQEPISCGISVADDRPTMRIEDDIFGYMEITPSMKDLVFMNLCSDKTISKREDIAVHILRVRSYFHRLSLNYAEMTGEMEGYVRFKRAGLSGEKEQRIYAKRLLPIQNFFWSGFRPYDDYHRNLYLTLATEFSTQIKRITAEEAPTRENMGVSP